MVTTDFNYMDPKLCDALVKVAELHKHKQTIHRDTKPLSISHLKGNYRYLCEMATTIVNNNICHTYSPNLYVELAQIVEWPEGSKQDFHLDEARDTTKLTSITYLNDDFEGGETSIKGHEVEPKKGMTVAFDGKSLEHGVAEVSSGTRWTLAIWYTDDYTLSLNTQYGLTLN